MNKKRVTGVVVLAIATVITAIVAYQVGINPPMTNVYGAFGAILAAVVATKIVKADDKLFFIALAFVFMASPMGSILDLYRSFGPYDKIVHLFSGCLLAAFGLLIIKNLLSKFAGVNQVEMKKFVIPIVFAACMFSSGCAGIWEIFEFVADKIAGGTMQRGMVDTVTDMIAGNIGALIYGIYLYIRYKKNPESL